MCCVTMILVIMMLRFHLQFSAFKAKVLRIVGKNRQRCLTMHDHACYMRWQYVNERKKIIQKYPLVAYFLEYKNLIFLQIRLCYTIPTLIPCAPSDTRANSNQVLNDNFMFLLFQSSSIFFTSFFFRLCQMILPLWRQ